MSAQKEKKDTLPIEMFSTEKKARRQKRWLFPLVLFFCAAFCALAVAGACFLYAPQKYTAQEVDAYVRRTYGDQCRLVRVSSQGDAPWKLLAGWLLPDGDAQAGEMDGREAQAGIGADRYVYALSGEEIFSVFAYSTPILRDGAPTGRYARAIYDNYVSCVMENKGKALDRLAREAARKDNLLLSIDTAGTASGDHGARYVFRLFLEGPGQIEPAARLLARLDGQLAFANLAGQTPTVQIYMKPDARKVPMADAVTGAAASGKAAAASDTRLATAGAGPSTVSDPETQGRPSGTGYRRGLDLSFSWAEDWTSAQAREDFRISSISLTNGASPSRLQEASLALRLENDYVDAAKTFGRSFYVLSEEDWDKYPAPVLTLSTVGGYDLQGPVSATANTYQLVYHRASSTYWMVGLDPCEDFDGNPFGDYPRRDAFARLVRCLGGRYQPGIWSGSWQIGENRWEATEEAARTPQGTYVHQSFRLARNGNLLPLDEVPETFAGAGALPSGRPFSIRDLIRMLDVRITINQKDMTAVMFRDYAQ